MNLADWLKKSHPPSEQVNIVEAVCEALHKAHAAGELRGEIGPSGLDIQGNRCEITSPSGPVPASYRAPESRSGGAPGPAAAVFSAGVLLYEILAGRDPFPAGASTDQPEPLRNVRRDLPSELTDAVMACLESDPDWRPKDLSYVLQVLKRLRGNTPAAAAPAPARSVSRPAPAEPRPRPEPARARKPQPAAKPTRSAKSGGPPLLAIAVGASVLIAAAVFFWLSSSRGPKPVASVSSGAATPAASPAAATPLPATPVRGVATPAPVVASTPLPATPTPLPVFTPVPTQAPSQQLPPPTPARAVATPVAVAIATPPPTPPPTPHPTAPPTPAPTAPPAPTPAAATTTAAASASAALATLKSVAPPTMPRGTTNFYDVHGTGLQTGLNAVIMKGRDVAVGVVVTKQAVVSPLLMRVVVRVDATVAPGAYSLILVDPRGQATNPVALKVP